MSSKLTPLLDLTALEFRPYEEGMEGWFVWRAPPNTDGEDHPHLRLRFIDDHGAMHHPYYVEGWEWVEPIGEFAGPVI